MGRYGEKRKEKNKEAFHVENLNDHNISVTISVTTVLKTTYINHTY